MNIEESVNEIEKIKEMFIHLKNYGWIKDIKKEINVDKVIGAIETLLTAYEKEKEKNKELIKQHAIEITDVDGNSIRIDLDGKIHNVYKIEEE